MNIEVVNETVSIEQKRLAIRKLLEEKILARKALDERWGKGNFLLAQSFTWIAILASFASAIIVASGECSKFWGTLLAALPGTTMVIEKSFSFAKRTRWNWEMIVGLEELHNQLMFEDIPVEQVSKSLSGFRKTMEAKYPGFSVEGLNEPKND